MNESDELLTNQILELRRGTIVLAILHHLKQPRYGYDLLQSLEESGIPVEAGTLYPLLRRLDKQGILESVWETVGNRPRKYYKLSLKGEGLKGRLTEEWKDISNKLNIIFKKKPHDKSS